MQSAEFRVQRSGDFCHSLACKRAKLIRFVFCVSLCLLLSSCVKDGNQPSLLIRNAEDAFNRAGGLVLPVDNGASVVSIMLPSEIDDLTDKVVMKELSERTGIKLNIISVHPSMILQRARTLLSANELPDIIAEAFSLSEINSLGQKGTFAPINKYFNELPNFRRTFLENEDYSNVFDLFAAQDNNLYIFPKYSFEREVEDGFLYRRDIFNRHGISLWEGPEEFYQALRQLKGLYPDSKPYMSKRGRELFSEWSTSFGIRFPGFYYENLSGEWKYSATDEKCEIMLDYIRKLYQEGLIDENFLTMGEVNYQSAMLMDDRVFVTYDDVEIMDYYGWMAKGRVPEYDLAYAPPIGPYRLVSPKNDVGDGPCVLNNANRLKSLKLLDYLLSPGGSELLSLGVENKTYNYSDGYTVNYLGFTNDEFISMGALREKFGLFPEGLIRTVHKDSLYHKSTSKRIEARIMIEKDKMRAEAAPIVRLTTQEKAELEPILATLAQRSYDFAIDYVMSGRHSDDKFSQFVKNMQKIGADRAAEIYNNAMKRN